LFPIAVELDATVAKSWGEDSWHIPFEPVLGSGERVGLENLLRVLGGVTPAHEPDSFSWVLKLGKFLGLSLYHKLCQGMERDIMANSGR
jgi:hypothetical protein